jgi:hypothetical protein
MVSPANSSRIYATPKIELTAISVKPCCLSTHLVKKIRSLFAIAESFPVMFMIKVFLCGNWSQNFCSSIAGGKAAR